MGTAREASKDQAEHEEQAEGTFHAGTGAALRVCALPGRLKPASSI